MAILKAVRQARHAQRPPKPVGFSVAAVVIGITPDNLQLVAEWDPPPSPFRANPRAKVPLATVLAWRKELKKHKRLHRKDGVWKYGRASPFAPCPFVMRGRTIESPLVASEQLDGVLMGRQPLMWMTFEDALIHRVWVDLDVREAWANVYSEAIGELAAMVSRRTLELGTKATRNVS